MRIEIKDADGFLLHVIRRDAFTQIEIDTEIDESTLIYSEDSSGNIAHSMQVDNDDNRFIISIE